MAALAGALVLWTGGTHFVVLIIIVSTAIAMLSISFAKETKDVDLSNVDQKEPATTS
ncbi:hypothetical protein [Arthrobacter ruber]|uniref:hypothetical protein n=1 Tax=Arthrobacter ruber TaxID=1258893 RepID=UPI0012FFEF88|nr:hypothetical protein [Arthrobacter ruber]